MLSAQLLNYKIRVNMQLGMLSLAAAGGRIADLDITWAENQPRWSLLNCADTNDQRMVISSLTRSVKNVRVR